MNYWITPSEFKQSPNQMYRSYIFNFQEDMWKYIYKTRNFSTKNSIKAIKAFEATMRLNYSQFHLHLKNPTNEQIITNHLNLIETRLHAILTAFGQETNTLFYKAVKKVHDEFGD